MALARVIDNIFIVWTQSDHRLEKKRKIIRDLLSFPIITFLCRCEDKILRAPRLKSVQNEYE